MENGKNNVWIWVLVIIVIVGLGWWLMARNGNEEGQEATTTAPEVLPPATTTPVATTSDGMKDAPQTVTVEYTASGFSPATVTIHKGDTVRWVNKSNNDMWVGSAMHPTHTTYSGTTLKEHCATGVNDSFDQCSNGDTYEFTFTKLGEWGYHNHSLATHTGKVVVK